MKYRRFNQRNRALTLIEVLVIVVVLGFLILICPVANIGDSVR